jgi:hypothetical protein
MRSILINVAVIAVVLFAVKSFAADTVTTTVGGANTLVEAPQTNPCPVNYVPVWNPVTGKVFACRPVPKDERVTVVKE